MLNRIQMKTPLVEMDGNGLAAARIAGQEAIAAHIAFSAADMKLFFHFLHGWFLPFVFVFIVYRIY